MTKLTNSIVHNLIFQKKKQNPENHYYTVLKGLKNQHYKIYTPTKPKKLIFTHSIYIQSGKAIKSHAYHLFASIQDI